MDELDMSLPSNELFAEPQNTNYNSYQDVNVGPSVEDPLNMGVTTTPDVANQGLSDKEMNFKALREEAAKLKQQSEYWRGQAEAYSKQPARQEPVAEANPYEKIDWDDGRDVRKAFDALRQENESMRNQFQDSLTAMSTKTKHQDWDKMVTDHVPQLTSTNPIFAEMIQKASNPYEAAYLLSELNQRAQNASQQSTQVNYAQRALTNSQKPQTLASVGGGGTLSSADYYANMSDDDFMKIAGKNLANI
jgi:hypothetical protein